MLQAAGYAISPLPLSPVPRNPLGREHFFDLYFSNIPKNFFFLQIGAHDGRSGDPLYRYIKRYGLRGVLVEPQKDIFKELERTHAGSAVSLVNAAISETTGTRTLYKPAGVRGSLNASLKKETVERFVRQSGADATGGRIEATFVDTLSFADLVERQGIKRVDLLQIDCEGYDAEVLKMFNFERFSPSLINYESKHLSAQEKAQCEEMLVGRGYRLFSWRADTCAYKIS